MPTRDLETAVQDAQPGTPAITFRDVCFSYGGPPVLEDVNLSIGRRDAVCMIGPNGGGKTTLVKLILGLVAPQRGEVRVFGLPPRRARLQVGYMPQHAQFDPRFPVTVMDMVLMGTLGNGCVGGDNEPVRGDSTMSPRTNSFGQWLSNLTGWHTRADHEAARAALAQVGMQEFAREPFASLSGGQRQRVLIARALCCRPDLLVLDEPTSNVDSIVEARLMEVLRELNRRMTILMVSHDLGFVSGMVERVVCVNRRVAVHPTSRLTGELISDLYGAERRVVRHGASLDGHADSHGHRADLPGFQPDFESYPHE